MQHLLITLTSTKKWSKRLVSSVAIVAASVAASTFTAATSAAVLDGDLDILVNGSTVVSGGNNVGVDYGSAADGVLDNDITSGLPGIPFVFDVFVGGSLALPSLPNASSVFFRDFSTSGVHDGSGTMFTYGDYRLEFLNVAAVFPTTGSQNGSVDFGGFGILKSISGTGFDDTNVSWVANVSGNTVGFTVNTNNLLPPTLGGVSEVPVPAAAWLFASALLGGMTLKRKR